MCLDVTKGGAYHEEDGGLTGKLVSLNAVAIETRLRFYCCTLSRGYCVRSKPKEPTVACRCKLARQMSGVGAHGKHYV